MNSHIPDKKIRLIIFSLIIILVCASAYFCMFQRIDKSENSQFIYSVPEYKIDSVLNCLTETEKIGLLLFLKADITDSSDYSNIIDLSKTYCISSWFLSAPTFSYHKQLSDALFSSCQAPGTYSVFWDWSTPDAGQLPPFHLMSGISDTTFFNNFSETYSQLLHNYGINSIVLPQIFKDTLTSLPLLVHLNKLISNSELIFQTRYFSGISIILNTTSVPAVFKDTIIPFPGNELYSDIAQNLGLSVISNHNECVSTNFFNVFTLQNPDEIKDFITSSFNMLCVNPEKTEEVFHLLLKHYRSNKYKDSIEKKMKQIIGAKLFQNESKSHISKHLVTAESTLWCTVLMQFPEKIACLLKNQNQTLPLSQFKAHIFVANKLHIPVFHSVMKSVFPEYRYTMSLTDSLTTSDLISRADNHITTIFIQDKNNRFHFDMNVFNSLAKKPEIILIDFSDELSNNIESMFRSILIMKHNSVWFQQTAAGVLSGTTNVSGLLNSYNTQTPFKTSETYRPIRLKYSYPEDTGLNGEYLNNTLDSMIQDAITRRAFPGCQVFGAKDGKIIFNKTYGHHTYEKKQTVQATDMYDVASVTKIAAATIAAMIMYEKGKLSLNETMKRYFRDTEINYTRIKPDTNIISDTINLNIISLEKLIKEKKLSKDTFRIQDTLLVTIDSIFSKATPLLNIFNVPIKNMLMHYSGIAPTLPILPFIQVKKYYLKNKGLTEDDSLAKAITFREIWEIYYTKTRTDSSKTQVADGIYLKNRWVDTLWQRTKEVGVSGKKYSQYTDLNMILLQMTIDSINKSNLYQYLKKEIYEPLGLLNTMYKPLDHNVSRSRIVPTEYDINWRKQLLHGHVHDPSAALLGGISGNAGLFSSALDLGILFQMLLNGGTYAGRRFLSDKTIALFTKTNPETGRGLGFDKYSLRNVVAPSASRNTYGHTGFTGCCVWIDPDYKLVFVFLSNRVHPSIKNHKINTLKIRQKAHQAFYDAEIKP